MNNIILVLLIVMSGAVNACRTQGNLTWCTAVTDEPDGLYILPYTDEVFFVAHLFEGRETGGLRIWDSCDSWVYNVDFLISPWIHKKYMASNMAFLFCLGNRTKHVVTKYSGKRDLSRLMFGLEHVRVGNQTDNRLYLAKVVRTISKRALVREPKLHLGTCSYCGIIQAVEKAMITAEEEKLGGSVTENAEAIFMLRTAAYLNITLGEETIQYITGRLLDDKTLNMADIRQAIDDGGSLPVEQLLENLVRSYLQRYRYIQNDENKWLHEADPPKHVGILDYEYYRRNSFLSVLAVYEWLMMSAMCSVFFCMDIGAVLVIAVRSVAEIGTVVMIGLAADGVRKETGRHMAAMSFSRMRLLFTLLVSTLSSLSYLTFSLPGNLFYFFLSGNILAAFLTYLGGLALLLPATGIMAALCVVTQSPPLQSVLPPLILASLILSLRFCMQRPNTWNRWNSIRVFAGRSVAGILALNVAVVACLSWLMPLGYSVILGIIGLALGLRMVALAYEIGSTGDGGYLYLCLLLVHGLLYYGIIPSWNMWFGYGQPREERQKTETDSQTAFEELTSFPVFE